MARTTMTNWASRLLFTDLFHKTKRAGKVLLLPGPYYRRHQLNDQGAAPQSGTVEGTGRAGPSSRFSSTKRPAVAGMIDTADERAAHPCLQDCRSCQPS